MAHRTVYGHRHAHLHHRHAAPFLPTPGSQTLQQPPSLVLRSASTCGADGRSSCDTPADDQNTSHLIIGVSVAVPLTLAIVVLFLLHRRIKRKQRLEDADEKHKSIDFGLDTVPGKTRKNKKGKPEMPINTNAHDFTGRKQRGMSMDMDFASPYMLPAGLAGSRESLHSMSRSLADKHDPYRPVTFARSDAGSTATPSRMRPENGSVYTGHSGRSTEREQAGLLTHAARMANGSALNSPEGSRKNSTVDGTARPFQRLPRKASLAHAHGENRWLPADDPKSASSSPADLDGVTAETPKDMLSYNHALPALPPPTKHSLPPLPATHESMPSYRSSPSPPHSEDALRINLPPSVYDRQNGARSPHALPPPPVEEPQHSFPTELPPTPRHDPYAQDVGLAVSEYDARRVSVMGTRPLPPDDVTDNPEQRANRIRSFYKEYFDETKPNPAGYYPDEDYYGGDLHDGAIYDPNTGAFFYSNEPPQQQQHHFDLDGRRAMTPPPRGPPQFMRGHRHVMSTQSAGRNRMPPKKQLPPPKALHGLPTPHLLKDDLGALVDFAPPSTFRQRQNGRAPDSPRGMDRPYSPSIRAHTPITSSFDDLAVMPSPHALRKSGTFTALDFAPPPRFRERAESMSETGSIRSNRSGVSSRTQFAIRNGAYRLSRLPKNQVGSMVDLQQSLKPNWDIGRK